MNPSLPRAPDPNPVMVSRTFVRRVNEVEIESTYGYVAAKEGDLWDGDLIRWAEQRESALRRKRADARST